MGWLSDRGSGFVEDRSCCSCKYDHNPVGNHIFGYAIIDSNPDCVGKHWKEFQCHTHAGAIRQMQTYLYHFQYKYDKKFFFFKKKILKKLWCISFIHLHTLDARK